MSRKRQLEDTLSSAMRAGGCGSPWIFILDTDKAEGSLMVLFFSLVYFCWPPWKFFCCISSVATGEGG